MYLPKPAWPVFDSKAPVKGEEREQFVTVNWQNGTQTESRIKFYASKNEYRITQFGRGFPWFKPEDVGSLFVFVRQSAGCFAGFVFAYSAEIELVFDSLSPNQCYDWGGLYAPQVETIEESTECVRDRIAEFARKCHEFPSMADVSNAVWQIVESCAPDLLAASPDRKLVEFHNLEFRLFSAIEKQLYDRSDHGRMLLGVDEFLGLALSMLNRRKKRAGGSLEFHAEKLLHEYGLEFESQPHVDGRPDLVLPSAEAYHDPDYPDKKLYVLAIKRTCRERWRQVLSEGERLPRKYLLTLQPGVSTGQFAHMKSAGVTLVVPKQLHDKFAEVNRPDLLSVQGFIAQRLAAQQ